ncbi:MAG: ABC transporter substrate-binding protein [Acidimicrobiales bacterium]
MATIAVPVSFSGALSPSNSNENAKTLDLSLPGPFNGCTYLDAHATPTTDALLDLTQPSAFITNANGTLVGEGGAIASAELTSLSPETVRYTIAPNELWSDGLPFNGADLVAWWQQAKILSSVTSDGYRAIKSLTISANGLSVTAVFAAPYADWDLLFRDLEEAGAESGCSIASLTSRPSLGPYEVASASARRVVLVMNSSWPIDPNRFGRIVVTDAQDYSGTTNYADYTLAVSRASLLALSNHPTLFSHIASSSNIEELTFSPYSALTSQLFMREALSWSIDRQTLIDKQFGAVTFSPSVAASVIYSQGQSQYPGSAGSNPAGQATTTTTTPSANGLSDCLSCAVALLKENGYVKSAKGWLSLAGTPLVVHLAVGPSDLDQSVAQYVRSDWSSIGINSKVVRVSSEVGAAQAAAAGQVDVALFARPTTTTPAYAASSWAGPAYPNTYPSGVRISEVTTLFDDASTIFNPVTASTTWLKLDQLIMAEYWARPLFTAPSLIVWSSLLAPVSSSFTLAGFVDQVPTWSIALPSTSS